LADFEDYTQILELPHDCLSIARSVVDATNGKDEGYEYRLRSALDYFSNSCVLHNYYLRFIMMVVVMERLFSFDKKGVRKQDQLAIAISSYMPSVSLSEVKKDYVVRNNLVHGPKAPLHGPKEIEPLADKWTSWCRTILTIILTKKRTDYIPTK